MPHLYSDLEKLIKSYEAAKKASSFDTFRLPDDWEKQQFSHIPYFGDEEIPDENIDHYDY